MALDIFLKLDGVEGEAQDETHKGEIDVLAWGWSLSQSGTTHQGSGSGGGKATFQDLSVTKWTDKATITLVDHTATGKHIDNGKLTVRKAGGEDPLEYLTIELKNIIITNVSLGGAGGEDRLTENVTLNFGEFKIIYREQTKKGGKGKSPDFGWNIAKNATV